MKFALIIFSIFSAVSVFARDCPQETILSQDKASPVIEGSEGYGVVIESSCVKGSVQLKNEINVIESAVTGGYYEGADRGVHSAYTRPSNIWRSHQSGSNVFKGHWQVMSDTSGVHIDGKLDCVLDGRVCLSVEIGSLATVEPGATLIGHAAANGHVDGGVVLDGGSAAAEYGLLLCGVGVNNAYGGSRVTGCSVSIGDITNATLDGWVGLDQESSMMGGTIKGQGEITVSNLISPNIDSAFFRIWDINGHVAFHFRDVQLCHTIPPLDEIVQGYTNCGVMNKAIDRLWELR